MNKTELIKAIKHAVADDEIIDIIREYEADKWISVEYRLPDEGVDVLVRICIFLDEYDTVVANYKKGIWFESPQVIER